MALPTIDDANKYLRIEHADEDVLVTQFLARAKGTIETFIGYPLTAAALTHIDYAEYDNYGVRPQLQLPGPFKTSSPAPVVTDRDGATVDASTYDLDPRGCRILAKLGYDFCVRPYSIAATIGLSAHPDYASRLEPVVSVAILEFVAHWYLHRDPSMSSETDESGATIGMGGIGAQEPLPGRIAQQIRLLPGPHAMGMA